MTRSSILAAILLVAVIITNAHAVDRTKWRYNAEVNILDQGDGEYICLSIGPEVYDVAKDDLSDIRLLDPNGAQIQYVLVKPTDKFERTQRNFRIIESSVNGDGATVITLDFNDRAVKNSIMIQTAGSNFRRDVKVEGSNDNKNFLLLVDAGRLFAAPVKGAYSFDTLEMPPNDYRYLRVTVWPMLSEDKAPQVVKIAVSSIEKTIAQRSDVQMKLIEHQEDQQDGMSIYQYEIAKSATPITELQFDVPDSAFYKFAVVRVKDDRAPWRLVSKDIMYRCDQPSKSEKLNLRFPSNEPSPKYVQIAINNFDEPAIKIMSATSKTIGHDILFKSVPGQQVRLYVGSESAKAPDYDLSDEIGDPTQYIALQASVGPIRPNPVFAMADAMPKRMQTSYVPIVVILSVAALVFGGTIFRFSHTSRRKKRVF